MKDVGNAASDVGHALTDATVDVVDAVLDEGVVDVGVNLFKQEVAQGARVLTELGRRSPQDFVDWLAGPEGPSFADQTALVPGLQSAIGKAFGFEYVPG